MATKFKDRATHFYPLGFSKKSEIAADERQTPTVAIVKPPTYDELLARIEALQIENAELKAQRQPQKVNRKSSFSSKSRGRRTAETVVMRKGITYYSMAHVAKTAGLNQSSVSRQIAKLGIKPELIGGINYIPASQASNIKRRKR